MPGMYILTYLFTYYIGTIDKYKYNTYVELVVRINHNAISHMKYVFQYGITFYVSFSILTQVLGQVLWNAN